MKEPTVSTICKLFSAVLLLGCANATTDTATIENKYIPTIQIGTKYDIRCPVDSVNIALTHNPENRSAVKSVEFNSKIVKIHERVSSISELWQEPFLVRAECLIIGGEVVITLVSRPKTPIAKYLIMYLKIDKTGASVLENSCVPLENQQLSKDRAEVCDSLSPDFESR